MRSTPNLTRESAVFIQFNLQFGFADELGAARSEARLCPPVIPFCDGLARRTLAQIRAKRNIGFYAGGPASAVDSADL
jgi:hypothetical protein